MANPFQNLGIMPRLRNNSDALLRLSAGLLGGQNAQQQLAGGIGGFADARASAKERQIEEAKKSRTMEWLKTVSPELAQAVEMGYPIREAIDQHLKAQMPGDAPTVQKLKRPDGSEYAVQWGGENWVPIDAPMGGGDITPKHAKLTESQSKLTLFKSFQEETQPVLAELEQKFNPGNVKDAFGRSIGVPGNFLQSQEGQIYYSAAGAWSEGALRIATGAAATPEEMERTLKTYFAQPGDTSETIRFKTQMREMYSRAIQRALGNTSVQGSLPKPSEFARQFDGGASPSASGSDAVLQSILDKYPAR